MCITASRTQKQRLGRKTPPPACGALTSSVTLAGETGAGASLQSRSAHQAAMSRYELRLWCRLLPLTVARLMNLIGCACLPHEQHDVYVIDMPWSLIGLAATCTRTLEMHQATLVPGWHGAAWVRADHGGVAWLLTHRIPSDAMSTSTCAPFAPRPAHVVSCAHLLRVPHLQLLANV